jgi:hypothetical protein
MKITLHSDPVDTSTSSLQPVNEIRVIICYRFLKHPLDKRQVVFKHFLKTNIFPFFSSLHLTYEAV